MTNCRDSVLKVSCQVLWSHVMPATKHQYGQSVFDAFRNRKPMQFLKQWRHMVVLASYANSHSLTNCIGFLLCFYAFTQRTYLRSSAHADQSRLNSQVFHCCSPQQTAVTAESYQHHSTKQEAETSGRRLALSLLYGMRFRFRGRIRITSNISLICGNHHTNKQTWFILTHLATIQQHYRYTHKPQDKLDRYHGRLTTDKKEFKINTLIV